MADVTELHQDARELLDLQHSELISQQFSIACHLPQHPCYQLCHRPPDDRPERRRSLIDRSKPNIQQYLAEELLSNTSYKSAISIIHQDVVRTVIEGSSSRLLNGRPPPIATAEQTLPRKTRTILAQLRTPITAESWSIHVWHKSDSAQPLPQLRSFASWHPPPLRLPFEAYHTDSRIAMDYRRPKHLNMAIDVMS